MLYVTIHLIHIISVFIYGGFLFTDNLFFAKMRRNMNGSEYMKVREVFMSHVRKVVPWSLLIAVGSGLYLFAQNFGVITEEGLSNFQIMLCVKAFLGLWLGFRGIAQKFFGIDPLVFKSHLFPFILVVIVIILSQIMFYV